MKLLLQQVLLFLLTWLTTFANATPSAQKLAIPNYSLSLPTTENQKLASEVKIGVEHYARSGISGKIGSPFLNSSSQKGVLQESCVVEGTRARVSEDVLQGAGGIISKLDNILAKPGFNGTNGLFNKLKALPVTPTRTANYASLQSFRDEFIRLHGLNNTGVKNIDDVLNDFENLVDNFSAIPNVEKYVDELMQGANKFKGGAFGLEILNDLPPSLQGKTLTKFEASIDDLDDVAGGCRFDLQFADGTQMVYIETKNYAQSTAFLSSFYNQFKAYISNSAVTDINQIKYYFRANSGVTKAERVQKFQNMLNSSGRTQEIFTSMSPQLKTSLLGAGNENNFQLFLNKINDPNSIFYQFIEVF